MSEQQIHQESTEEERAAKNAIFATRDAVAKIKAEQAGMLPSTVPNPELGITVQTINAILPSSGLAYVQGHPLHGKDEVEVKTMTAKEENILMSKSLIKKGTVINELLKSSLINKDIDVLSLLSGDRMALVFAIRAAGYGDDFEQKMTCPECEHSQDETYLVSEFKIKDLDLEKVKQVEPGENLFSFTLPVLKKEVWFKFLTGKDEESILQAVEAKKKKGLQNDESVTTRLFHSIVAVDGKTDKNFINKIVQNLPAKDSRALMNHIEENEPGIDTKRDFTCNNCDFQGELTPPMGVSFLWPGK